MKNDRKRILFISPRFFDYETKIITKFIEVGYEVDYYNERPSENIIIKSLNKISKYLIYVICYNYYNMIYLKTKNVTYDYIIFIKGELIPLALLKKMKGQHKESKFILYLWDSLKNLRLSNKKISMFDSVLSFDRHDCISSKFKFLPLFYIDIYSQRSTVSNEIHACFIGTFHSKRYTLVKEVVDKCSSQTGNSNFFSYIYIQNKIIYYIYRLFAPSLRNTRLGDFRFTKLTSMEVSNILDRSDIIIDINHQKQTGLTMRTFEVLAKGKRLITTNSDIRNYDFFDENQILIIDRDNIVIPNEFRVFNIKNDFTFSSKYSLESWIKNLLNN